VHKDPPDNSKPPCTNHDVKFQQEDFLNLASASVREIKKMAYEYSNKAKSVFLILISIPNLSVDSLPALAVQDSQEYLIRFLRDPKAVKTYFATKRAPHGQSYQDVYEEFSRKETLSGALPASHLVRGSGSFSGEAQIGVPRQLSDLSH
jgi:hypothetical protein